MFGSSCFFLMIWSSSGVLLLVFGNFCSREIWRPERTVVPVKKFKVYIHNWIRKRLELQYSDIGLVFVGYLCNLSNFCYVSPFPQPSVLIHMLLINLLNVHAYSGTSLLSYCLKIPCIAWGYLLFGQATSGFFFIVIYDSKYVLRGLSDTKLFYYIFYTAKIPAF